MVEIRRIDPKRTPFVLGTTFLPILLLWLGVVLLDAFLAPSGTADWATVGQVAFLVPIAAIIMAGVTWLFCLFYNLIAPRIGGIRIALDERGRPAG